MMRREVLWILKSLKGMSRILLEFDRKLDFYFRLGRGVFGGILMLTCAATLLKYFTILLLKFGRCMWCVHCRV